VLLTKCNSGDQRNMNEMDEACGTHGVEHTESWWGNPEGRRRLGRPRRSLEDNLKIDAQERELDL